MRIGIAGAFDTADGEREATRRVVEIELRRRLPGCEVVALSPLGLPHPLDGGRPVEALPRSPEEVATLASRFDCLVALGDVDPELEAALAVVRPGDGAPPLALLLPHRLDPELLRRRAEFLRLVGWAWPAGRVLTVVGDAADTECAGDLVAALRPQLESGAVRVQLAATATGRGEEAFADALEALLGEGCRRLPGLAAIEDLVALVAGSAAYLGPPGLGMWTAVALGVPAASVAVAGEPARTVEVCAELGVARPEPAELGAALAALLAPATPPARPAAALERLEGEVAGLAARVAAAAGGAAGRGGEELEALRQAHQARGRQLFAERRAFAAEREAAVAGLESALARARAEAERLRAELAAARAANDAMVGSRTWRYTQPVRDGLAWARERRR